MSANRATRTWQRTQFGDVIQNVSERVDDPRSAGVDRYVGLEHLEPGSLTVRRWGAPESVAAQKLRFYPKDVIFGRRRAYQKKVAMAEFEGICSAHALVLRGRSGLVHPDFLPVFLSSDYFLDRAVNISVGSLSPTVNWRDLRVQEFELPPIDEQIRISQLLWSLERYKDACETARESVLLAFRTALSTLCDPSAPDARPIEEVCEILDRHRVPLNASERAARKGEVPYYGATGQVDFVDSPMFDEDLVLVGEDGAGLAEWRVRPIAYRISGPSWVNNHAHVLRATRVSTSWLHFSLMHYDLTSHIATGTRPKLTLGELKKMKIRSGQGTARDERVIFHLSETVEALDRELIACQGLRSSVMSEVFGDAE